MIENNPVQAQVVGSYRSIRASLLDWNWQDAVTQFHEFCECHREHIPAWYEDEFVFSGMKLWAADRPVQVLRHFALFFDRALGAELCWSEQSAAPLRLTADALGA